VRGLDTVVGMPAYMFPAQAAKDDKSDDGADQKGAEQGAESNA
jgi:hypothetical protein